MNEPLNVNVQFAMRTLLGLNLSKMKTSNLPLLTLTKQTQLSCANWQMLFCKDSK